MSPIVLIFVVGILVVAAFFLVAYQRKASAAYPYMRKRLFSQAERSFLGVLDQAVGGEYRIFAKIRVGDIMEPQRALNNSHRQSAFNRTSGKHFDFVLCTPGELGVVCALELDDRSHQRSSRQDRDEFLEGVCKAVSLPLVRIQARRAYSVAELRAAVQEAVSADKRSLQATTSSQHPGTTMQDAEIISAARGEHGDRVQPDVPSCPRCSAPMSRRRTKEGPNPGQEFWGCSSYPKCRGTLAITT